jgi:hypothetical protein
MLNNLINEIIKVIECYEDQWDLLHGLKESYSKTKLSATMPKNDYEAYYNNIDHQYIYDKLWVANSQHIQSGKMADLLRKTPEYINYPIVIKPRWGHLSNKNRHIYKINSFEELKRFRHLKDMIWTDYFEGSEETTDFLIRDGKIIHNITYEHSTKPSNIVSDKWKKIASGIKPPAQINNWVETHMKKYTGIFNVQYIGDRIIESSLRFARGGAYIYGIEDNNYVDKINKFIEEDKWEKQSFEYEPYYAYKCYSYIPLFYLLPNKVMQYIMKINGCKEFNEYYFENNEKSGQVFYQFFHNNFKKGLHTQKTITNLTNFMQIFFISLVVLGIIFLQYPRRRYAASILIPVALIYITTAQNHLRHFIELFNIHRTRFLDY